MRRRIIKNALITLVVPFATIIFLARFSYSQKMQIILVVCGTLLQIMIVFLCKRSMKSIVKPDLEMMISSGVERMPAPYEPGRFDIDFRISSFTAMLGVLAPILAYMAYIFKKKVSASVLQLIISEPPNISFIFLSLAAMIIGALSLVMWVMAGQAKTIANEGSENKRYLYRGYAEKMDHE